MHPVSSLCAQEADRRIPAIVSELTDPKKLATLEGKRAATPRLRKSCYWLETAKRKGQTPEVVIETAQKQNKSFGTERA